MKDELKPICRSLLRLADKVFEWDMDWCFGGDRELFMDDLKGSESHEEVYERGVQLNEYLQDEFFESSEWDDKKVMVARWLKTWKNRKYVILTLNPTLKG